MKKNLAEWLQSGQYLPKVLRDFHDQKDIFKAFHKKYKIDVPQPDNKNEYMMKEIRGLSWVSCHIFSIDFFLYFMAKHGYVLTKSNQKIDFEDLGETLEASRKNELEYFASAMKDRESGNFESLRGVNSR